MERELLKLIPPDQTRVYVGVQRGPNIVELTVLNGLQVRDSD
jgi:hypothetical protein